MPAKGQTGQKYDKSKTCRWPCRWPCTNLKVNGVAVCAMHLAERQRLGRQRRAAEKAACEITTTKSTLTHTLTTTTTTTTIVIPSETLTTITTSTSTTSTTTTTTSTTTITTTTPTTTTFATNTNTTTTTTAVVPSADRSVRLAAEKVKQVKVLEELRVAATLALYPLPRTKESDQQEEADAVKGEEDYKEFLHIVNCPYPARGGRGQLGKRRASVDAAYKMAAAKHPRKAGPVKIKPALTTWFLAAVPPTSTASPLRSVLQLDLERVCLDLFPLLPQTLSDVFKFETYTFLLIVYGVLGFWLVNGDDRSVTHHQPYTLGIIYPHPIPHHRCTKAMSVVRPDHYAFVSDDRSWRENGAKTSAPTAAAIAVDIKLLQGRPMAEKETALNVQLKVLSECIKAVVSSYIMDMVLDNADTKNSRLLFSEAVSRAEHEQTQFHRDAIDLFKPGSMSAVYLLFLTHIVMAWSFYGERSIGTVGYTPRLSSIYNPSTCVLRLPCCLTTCRATSTVCNASIGSLGRLLTQCLAIVDTELNNRPKAQARQDWVAKRVECLSELAYTVNIMSNDGSLHLVTTQRDCVATIVSEVVKLFSFEENRKGGRRLRLSTRVKKANIEGQLHSCITTLQLLSKTLA